MYYSSKTYGHDIGLSCCFRQWRATHSHCQYLHGYALAVHIEFKATGLDELNWVVDFGNLKDIKGYLQTTFDHTLIIARDDPEYATLKKLGDLGLAQITVATHTGCEYFAELIAREVCGWLVRNNYTPRVEVAWVEVREHGANSARYEPKDNGWR